jgi:putative redox protein
MEVKHILRGKGISPKAVAQAIELSENKYCSVAATLRPTVQIVSTFEIIED